MRFAQRKIAFLKLGELFRKIGNGGTLDELCEHIYVHNGWFTPKNVQAAIRALGEALKLESMDQWDGARLCAAKESTMNASPIKNIAVIMAGNIPLVGFHDFLCVLLSGNKVTLKPSAKDDLLMRKVVELLIGIEPAFASYITFSTGVLKDIDAVIATGSTNSSRYFEYYFGKYPHIIRKNRNSVAVLNGNESADELALIGKDVFQYFGLGCRNVSKLLVPAGYDFDLFFGAIFDWKFVLENNKYVNNYDYNKTVYLMKKEPLLENGFLLLKEDRSLTSPVAVLFYEYYHSMIELNGILQRDREAIQCIVSASEDIDNRVLPGRTQTPALGDYADGIDTIDFLLHLP